MALVQSDILTTLAYLMGERTVNATTSTSRADFIQQTLDECYAATPWRFARSNATLTISSGIATLPTDFDITNPVNFSFITGTTELDLDEIDVVDKDQVNDGDRKVWITTAGSRFIANTKDTTPINLLVQYSTKTPVLDSAGTVSTNYPNKMTIALGARRYVKLGQNPDADISQDQKLFEKMLAKDMSGDQIPAPRKQRRTRQQQRQTHTGDF